MKEDQNTISFLKERNLCKTISEEELKSLKIDDILINELKYPSSDIQKNQLNEIVDMINKIITST